MAGDPLLAQGHPADGGASARAQRHRRPAEMLAEMTDELQRAMGRVESKVDLLLSREAAHDTRISALEKRVWWATGAGALITFIATKIPGLGHIGQ